MTDIPRFRMNLVCCTSTIVREVAMKEMHQKDIALTYALALKSQAQGADNPDWEKINKAILARWSMSGLERIKKRAWNLVLGKAKP